MEEQALSTETPAAPPSPLLSEEEAAYFLRMAPATLGNHRRAGKAPPYTKIGGRAVYHRGQLEQWFLELQRSQAVG